MSGSDKERFNYVCHLGDCTKESLILVGGKNANLGEMLNHGFAVPDGFVVTVNAYQRVLERIDNDIRKELQDLCSTDMDAVDQSSKKIRDFIRSVGMFKEIKEEILRHYQKLSDKFSVKDIPVAVRSSATAEDLPGASFAGQQDTFLWVRGKDSLIKAVIDCWASLFTSRAICYRMNQGFDHDKVLISVGVQRMIAARTAGVMFTINPVNGDRSKIMIGGCWGLGEGVVSGSVSTDEWMVDKVVLEIAKRTIVPKTIMHAVDHSLESEAVLVKDVPMEKQEIACLSDEEVVELARIGKAIERHYGRAQDIEWAIDKGSSFPQNIFILQTRPETVWSEKKTKPILNLSGNTAGQVCSYLSNLKA